MNTKTAFRLLLAIVFSSGGCASSTPKADTTASAASQPSGVAATQPVQGTIATTTYSATATVSAIDPVTRRVTLQRSDGSIVSFIAGPEVRNFDRIHVGDHVTATVDTELVIAVRKSGGPPVEEGAVSVVGRAPKGEQPAAAAVTSMQGVAKIANLDIAHRQATLVFSDGSTQTFPVRPGIDLGTISVGDEVVFRATQAHSIVVTP
jgi:Cu/Ag efflux protein CusF